METREYLEELGVKKINSLDIDGEFTGWQQISFFKVFKLKYHSDFVFQDFHVENIDIDDGLPDVALRSFLQLNVCKCLYHVKVAFQLNSFSYYGPIQGDLLLQTNSSIPQIKLLDMESSADVFTQILGVSLF